jgi:hypothetical protein
VGDDRVAIGRLWRPPREMSSHRGNKVELYGRVCLRFVETFGEVRWALKFPTYPFLSGTKREIRGFALFCRSPDALAKGVIHPCQTLIARLRLREAQSDDFAAELSITYKL